MIDCWVNPNRGGNKGRSEVNALFPGLAARRERGTTLLQLIDEMDEAGVVKAVLCAGYGGYDAVPWMEKAIENHPERFVGSLIIDPRTGMDAVRLLESGVRGSGVRLARVMALETQRAYDDAIYYPVYAKCVELNIPVCVNVGLPGPRVPGRTQDPISLDEVCFFFPELTVVMSHGGDPWADVCVKLMSKWPNLYYMSSAYAPKYIPSEVISYMNGRGADRIMWATDYPILEFRRCRREIAELPFRDDERRRKFAHDNAETLFFHA
jgi:predicted TIM-barrel fold metal-dependent hydrolase